MSFAFTDTLYGPMLDVFGSSGTLTISGGSAVSLTMLDRTRGMEVTDLNLDMPTIRPAVALRRADLDAESIALTQLRGAALSVNGKSWTVDSHMEKPTPAGLEDGLVLLFLLEA